MKKIKLKESDLRRIVRRVIKENVAAGAFVHVDICGGPNQGMGTTICLSIGGQPAQAGQKVLAIGSTWAIVEGNATTLPNGNPMTPQNTHVCEVSLGNVATGTPCNPGNNSWSPIQNAWTGGCVYTTPTTPTGGCDAAAWSGYNTWISNWTNSGPFNNQTNPNQPCNHICKQINTWTNNLTNVGTTQANQLNCKVDEGNNQSQINGCNC